MRYKSLIKTLNFERWLGHNNFFKLKILSQTWEFKLQNILWDSQSLAPIQESFCSLASTPRTGKSLFFWFFKQKGQPTLV